MSKLTWMAALATYLAKRSYSDMLANDHAEVDTAVDAYCEAMDVLIDTRAPSHAALIYKLDLIAERYEDFNTPEQVWLEVRKDVAALGAAANGEA